MSIRTNAQTQTLKVNKPARSKNLLSLHLLPFISPSTSCHLSGRGRTEEKREKERERGTEIDRETLGQRADCLDWYRRMWRALSSLISPPLSLACLLSLHQSSLSVSVSQFISPSIWFGLTRSCFHTEPRCLDELPSSRYFKANCANLEQSYVCGCGLETPERSLLNIITRLGTKWAHVPAEEEVLRYLTWVNALIPQRCICCLRLLG